MRLDWEEIKADAAFIQLHRLVREGVKHHMADGLTRDEAILKMAVGHMSVKDVNDLLLGREKITYTAKIWCELKHMLLRKNYTLKEMEAETCIPKSTISDWFKKDEDDWSSAFKEAKIRRDKLKKK